jgi:hypothetical protein
MRRTVSRSQAPLAIAVLVGAIALAGCGGSGEESESTTAPPSDSSVERAVPAPKQVSPNAKKLTARAKEKRANRSTPGVGQAGEKNRKQRSNGGGKQNASAAPESKGSDATATPTSQPAPEGCPAGVSARVCSKASETHGQAPGGSGQKVAKDRCPSSLSQAECKALGKAVEGAPEGGPAEPAASCPPSLSAAECDEVARAYAEASK